MDCEDGLERLRAWMRGRSGMAIAYSGGGDSTLLAAVAAEQAPGGYQAFYVDLPYISRMQRRAALETAEALDLDLVTLPAENQEFEAVRRNDRGRCYHCKAIIYDMVSMAARQRGLGTIVDGENPGDEDDVRPGRVAARERGVISPLVELGIGRDAVESMVKHMGLPVRLSKESCLATRLEPGAPWDDALLDRIERAESFLHEMGVGQARVRVSGDDARIEVAPADMAMLAGMGRKVHTRLRELGFRHVSLDLKGYRSGSMWE